MAEFPELDALRSVEELSARLSDVKAELTRMDTEAAGRPFDPEERDKFAYLRDEAKEATARIDELNARTKIVADLAGDERHVERPTVPHQINSPGKSVARGGDIYDLSTLDRSSEDAVRRDLHERALKSIDTSQFPDKDAKDKVEKLLDTVDADGAIARRIVQTGSPMYKRAFSKMIAGRLRTPEEERTLQIGSDGNYPVPYVVDPTVALTSNGAINPVRQIARVIQIAGNHWTGVASSGISASYDAEAAEVSNDTPTLVQPSADVEMARAFVKYSMELDDDWGSLAGEMARMFATAKDELESTKFLKGLGHASHEPEGLLVGSSTGTLLTISASAIACWRSVRG